MKLELTIRRAAGSRISFGPYDDPDVVYHFKGTDGGPHVCEVGNPAHVKQLLSVEPVGTYREFKASKSSPHPSDGDEGTSGAALGNGAGGEPNELTEARRTYLAAFGRTASPRWDLDTVRAKIAEAG